MQRTIITTVLLLGALVGAHASSLDTYRDLIRPNGHPRSNAIHQADLDFCYRRTGASRYRPDTPAFKQCMLGRGYRWTSVRIERTPPAVVSEPYRSHGDYNPPVEIDPPPQLVFPPTPPPPQIDPITLQAIPQ